MLRRALRFVALSGVVGLPIGLAQQPALAAVVSTGSAVVSYNAGSLSGDYAGPGSSWTSGPAIGLPASTEGGIFGDTSVITPFNAQYNPVNLVGISGAGGVIEFQLSQPIATNGFTLGVHVGAGLNDSSYPTGVNGPVASTYTNPRQATVLVSQDGTPNSWKSLGDLTFNNPTNIYADASDPYASPAGSVSANFAQPFTGTVASFNNENFSQVLATLNGSGGGTWLDLSGTGLSQVNYVEFETDADQLPDEAGEMMYVNAITGIAVPEPVTVGAIGLGFLLLARRDRKSGVANNVE